MIWGKLKPNFRYIHLDSVSVLKEPHKARLYMSVCPQDDTGTKRNLWKALQDISANCAILLTTHNMEEAEALAESGVAGGV
jgi:hypothetical protein